MATNQPTPAQRAAAAEAAQKDLEDKLNQLEKDLEAQEQDCERRTQQLEQDLAAARTDRDRNQQERDDAFKERDLLQDQLDDAHAFDVSFDEALGDAAVAYRVTFASSVLMAAGIPDALEALADVGRSGRLAPADAGEEGIVLALRLSQHLDAPIAIGRLVAEAEPLVFDQPTRLPSVVARLVDAVRAYLDALCDCEGGTAIWAEVEVLLALQQVREDLVATSTAWSLSSATVLGAASTAVSAILERLPSCPTPGALGGDVETVALWAGRKPADARAFQRWFDVADLAVERVLELVQLDHDPTQDELTDLARLIAPLTVIPSPLQFPLVRVVPGEQPSSGRFVTAGGKAAHAGTHQLRPSMS